MNLPCSGPLDRRRRCATTARAALALLGALLVLTACGTTTPTVDTTAPVGQSGDANASAGSLLIRDARFAAQRPRAGNEVYETGADAPLSVSVVNTGDATDRLTSVSSPVASDRRISGDTEILDGFTLVSGYQDSSPERFGNVVRADITLTGLREPLRAGLTYPVTFTFARSGSVTVQVPLGDPDTLPPRADDNGSTTRETGPG